MNQNFLEEIGLTKGEIALYTALLETGQSTTGPLIKKAKITPSKVYPILDKLIEKGLASFIIKAGAKHFQATAPERILDYLEEKEKRITQQKEDANSFIEEIRVRQQEQKTQSDATIFKGLKGLKTAYEVVRKQTPKGETVYGMFIPQVRNELLPFFKNYISQYASEWNVKNLLLFNEYSTEINLIKNIQGVEVRIIPEELKAPTEISIHHNTVIIATTGGKEYFTLVIENKEVTESFKKYFHTIWNLSQPIR